MVLPLDVLIQLAQVDADPELAIALRGHYHGSAPISGLVNSGYDSCLQLLSNSSLFSGARGRELTLGKV